MTKWSLIAICIHFVTVVSAFSQVGGLKTPVPNQFLISRHTFFDVGPPFDFYDVFSVEAADGGTTIRRITVVPPALGCMPRATVDIATVTIADPIAQLLGKTDPCAIPEGKLKRERKRCKNCPVFSGADVAISVECGGKARWLRMDILDRDMFDPNPKTPEYTWWTMVLLNRLDSALGSSVIERPAFAISDGPEKSIAEARSTELIEYASQGKYDALFENVPHKLSELVLDSRKPSPVPTVKLAGANPVRPTTFELPKYPPIARFARFEGDVVFSLDVTPSGRASNVRFAAGHLMLQKSVESALPSWSFPPEAVGKEILAVIHFEANCPQARE